MKGIGSAHSRRRITEFPGDGARDNRMDGKPIKRKTVHKGSDRNSSEKPSTSKALDRKPSTVGCRGHEKSDDKDFTTQKIHKRRKRKRRKENGEHDEASRLQRRTRYLLIKMKLEQNLIDAYSGEGWKGQSREKIKPEKELQRAKKQILKCKLGIRDAIHQLHMLSAEGCIEESVIAPDGSVFHEHIFCAKCKLRDAFPDNDIILCDGTCNCAFHQKCLDPPLATENIPPGDQGWYCKFCECKMEILDAVNAHLGTQFPMNSNWQDVFKEAAELPDGGSASLNPEEEWPSDDSEDCDYDPERNEKSCSETSIEDNISDDASSFSSLSWSFGEEASLQSRRSGDEDEGSQGRNTMRGDDNKFVDSFIGDASYNNIDREIKSRCRQRKDVDYKKLHDEMFGKDVAENEQVSEDEDWGPGRKTRREKESDAVDTLMTLCENENACSNVVPIETKEKKHSVSRDKKPLFRIPPSAVEKLRQVFAENELPSRAVKEDLSNQLGLASEKVNKWFKNARYTALRIRKAESMKELGSSISIPEDSSLEIGKYQTADQVALKDNPSLVPSETGVRMPKNLRKVRARKNPKSIISLLKKKKHKKATNALLTNKNEVRKGFNSLVNLKKQMSNLKRKAPSEKRVNLKSKRGSSNVDEMKKKEKLYMAEMERLCHLEDRIEKLKKVLLRIQNGKNLIRDKTHSCEQVVIYVPVAEIREKQCHV